jgi:hypothetical protein
MHKKIESELTSLAHKILQMKDKNDVVKLKNKAKEVYEKLSVLDFVNNYFLTTPHAKENKEEIIDKIEKANLLSIPELSSEKKVDAKKEVITPKDKDLTELKKISEQNQAILKTEAKKIAKQLIEKEKKEVERLEKIRLESIELAKKAAEIKEKESEKQDISKTDDFKDSIPADVAANLFEKAPKAPQVSQTSVSNATRKSAAEPVKETQVPAPSKSDQVRNSLNDKIFKGKIQIGLNDRIAFVKHLFNFSQEDFNRVLSQLNSFKSEKEAKDFLINTVQVDYDWAGKEEYIERLFMLIERRFA